MYENPLKRELSNEKAEKWGEKKQYRTAGETCAGYQQATKQPSTNANATKTQINNEQTREQTGTNRTEPEQQLIEQRTTTQRT